jgi:GT2 family glycosyltransferase
MLSLLQVSTKKLVIFIHVNYNGTLETINCVNSIFGCFDSECNVNIIIVDNNSSVNEKDKIINWYETQDQSIVKLLMLKENIGYFSALNYGLMQSTKISDADFVVIGNNDLIFNKNFISNILKKNYGEDVFVVSPDIINNGGNHQNPHVVYKYSRLQLIYLDIYHLHYIFAYMINFFSAIIKFRGMQKSRKGCETRQFISIGYGACYILTKKYLINIKKIPSYLFFMNEENALSNEVFKHGGRILYDPELVVFHTENTSAKKILRKKLYEIEQQSYRTSKKYFKNSLLYDKKLTQNDNYKSGNHFEKK